VPRSRRTPKKNARLQVFQYEIKRFLDETTHTPACRSPGARGQGLRAKGQGAKGQGCQVPCFSSISQSASLSPNVKYPQLQSEHTPGSCSYVAFLPSPNRRAFCPLAMQGRPTSLLPMAGPRNGAHLLRLAGWLDTHAYIWIMAIVSLSNKNISMGPARAEMHSARASLSPNALPSKIRFKSRFPQAPPPSCTNLSFFLPEQGDVLSNKNNSMELKPSTSTPTTSRQTRIKKKLQRKQVLP
jgi:hypothetical protein